MFQATKPDFTCNRKNLSTLNVTKLPVVLYGCENLFLTFREENRRRAFRSRVSRKVRGPKRGEVTGEWRRLHNENLYDLYSSPGIRGNTKMGCACSTYCEK
jgi:hypothetical protein